MELARIASSSAAAAATSNEKRILGSDDSEFHHYESLDDEGKSTCLPSSIVSFNNKMKNDANRNYTDDEGDGICIVDKKNAQLSSLSSWSSPSFSWRAAWNAFWFPPDIPPSCQLFRLENMAIPASYLMVGLLQGLSGPLINVLPLDLGASEAAQTTLAILDSLPASFKLLFGFTSDNWPILGYRRKSYMVLGWLIASASCGILLWQSNLRNISHDSNSNGIMLDCFSSTKNNVEDDKMDENVNENDDKEAAPQGNNNGNAQDAPSIPFLAFTFLIFGCGFWLADVMADALVAEKAKLEPHSSRGNLQSTCYSYRFFGVMCAVPLSTYLYTAYGPDYVVWLLSILPLCILPAVYYLGEVPYQPVKPTTEQCHEIWNTVCSRATWQPMGFVFLYNTLQVGNAAWKEFGRTVLGFTSCQFNLIFMVCLVLLYLGILIYKYCFINSSWRNVYVTTTLMGGLLSILQVLLIYGKTFGLSPFWFALGDDAFSRFVGGIQFLPTTIMMVHLCPAGSEGASYAMFTTVSNSAANLSAVLSTLLLRIWDVSKQALEQGDLTGMIKLTYLTSAIQLSAILFVGLLPHTKDDLMALRQGGHSRTGGFLFLAITFLAVAFASVVGLSVILSPGWM